MYFSFLLQNLVRISLLQVTILYSIVTLLPNTVGIKYEQFSGKVYPLRDDSKQPESYDPDYNTIMKLNEFTDNS